jgi:secreted trypsin-like serine protease
MFSKIFGLVIVLGFAAASPNHRVVNGTDANIEDYPFVVMLRRNATHRCGATILSPDWVLTAAHCVDSDASEYTVQYATQFISSVGNIINVDRYIIHEKYIQIGEYRANDIAILKLKSPIPLGPKAQLTKLPPPYYEVPENENNCTLVGWGRDKTGGNKQDHLQKVDYFIVANSECKNIHYETIYPHNICAAYPGGGKGQCNVSILSLFSSHIFKVQFYRVILEAL